MGEGELIGGRVPPFQVLDGDKELDVVPEGTRDGAQAADVFGVSPPGVVPPTIGVRNEGGGRS